MKNSAGSLVAVIAEKEWDWKMSSTGVVVPEAPVAVIAEKEWDWKATRTFGANMNPFQSRSSPKRNGIGRLARRDEPRPLERVAVIAEKEWDWKGCKGIGIGIGCGGRGHRRKGMGLEARPRRCSARSASRRGHRRKGMGLEGSHQLVRIDDGKVAVIAEKEWDWKGTWRDPRSSS